MSKEPYSLDDYIAHERELRTKLATATPEETEKIERELEETAEEVDRLLFHLRRKAKEAYAMAYSFAEALHETYEYRDFFRVTEDHEVLGIADWQEC